MPWGRLDDGLYDHPKLDALGRSKLPAIGLWTLTISWSNRRLTDGFVPSDRIRALGGTSSIAELLVTAGLFDRVDGGYAIHDFLEFNDSAEIVQARRDQAAERQRRHRAVTGEVTDESQRESRRDTSVSHSTHARASGRASRPDPSRPTESLERDSSRATTKAERADVAALHARGWKRVTKAQRTVLDEILSRHDVTGPEFAAEAIRSAPADADPLEAAMAADRIWQQAQRRRADVEASGWQATKAQERTDAERIATEPPDWLRSPAEARS